MNQGFHLIVDLKECMDSEKLLDRDFIKKFLVDLAKLIEMKIIFGPEVVYYEHKEKEESGITGFLIISDSHITVHTYPFKKSLYLDLFSCKKFNYEKVTSYITRIFIPKDLRFDLIKR